MSDQDVRRSSPTPPATPTHRRLPESPHDTHHHHHHSPHLQSQADEDTPRPHATKKLPARPMDYVVMGRPKFLMYSLACHAVGVLVALQQGCEVDLVSCALLQLTVWCTHLMTHYINEYGDYEADKLNTNAGSWTGGSKILHSRGLSRNVALVIGIVLQVLAFLSGAACVLRFVNIRHGVPLDIPQSTDDALELVTSTFAHLPHAFVLFGVSVFFVAFAYSLPPLRLSAVGLGEVCVSYVLTFSTPVVGCLLQGGSITFRFVLLLIPIFIMNLNRMIIMNIPDRHGDAAAGKVTSVVMVGEHRAVAINNILYLATYLIVLPQLQLGPIITTAYLLPLPLRWWQSLRINTPHWWGVRHLVDSIPFVESVFILTTVVFLVAGLACELDDTCAAWFSL
ncbi:hypothetical protein PTSG_04557 [Salpingoeca rosetta]|uniref:1,4-dihydroxy-2-naphthoate octaprenyltransferase n=1 Tax=Salpingoeca rosetta (strain ATCC 50818 / BSB-021) TaxID=946362 RepID=F2U7S3_SALR5|nr:uncharacterized protein PTSG_04557 [Salpingoeca rosetta]EGD72828.1 hypothetical protein PTSG_04557 [Salpingoeca rosetta]|eukprot:XP_004994651.1 hypothetical protein PTSG_04557 [Salpingoeca rosetta]